MAAGDLITADAQIELRGLLLGTGTDYAVSGPIEGLGDLEVRSNSPARPLDHGRYAGRSFYGERHLIVPIAIFGGNDADAMAKLVALGSAMRVPTAREGVFVVPLVFRLGGLRLTAFGKPSRMHVDPTYMWNGATIQCVLEFVASDPRLYGDQRTTTASTGAVVGGLSLPHSFPHGFGNATPGTANAANAGNFESYPTMRITAGVGGMSNFSVSKAATGEVLSMTISLAAGEFIDLDFGERTALVGGTSSRSNLIDRPSSTWFALDPGANAVVFATGTGAGSLTLSWRDAYIFG